MSCLLSQINSPSIDLQDCLTETGTMEMVLSAALGRDCAAVRRDDEKEEEEDGGGTNGKQSEKVHLLPSGDTKTSGNVFGTRGGALMSSDLNNPVVEWNQLFGSKFCPVPESGQAPLENCSAAQKFTHKSLSFLSSRKERANEELLKQFRNEEFSAEDFVGKRLFSFGRHSFDALDAAASEMSQENVDLDTGSTVSLNELLDLAVVDPDDDPGTLTEIHPDPEDQATTKVPLTEEGSSHAASCDDVACDNVNIPKGSRNILPFPENNIKMLLPDVCPDNRNLTHV